MRNKLISIALVVVMVLALGLTAVAASNSQEVTGPTSRIWQDGFGFHCNQCGGNGATAVIYKGSNKAVIAAIANLKKQPAGSMLVEKGEQKNIFGTKIYPITIERVGDTTLWNLVTGDDIECATCHRTDWVTYSNKNGVVEGKNIQAHHPPLPDVVVPYGGLSFEKKVEGVSIVEWLGDKGYKGIEAILNGLEFYLVNSDGKEFGPADVDLLSGGVYTFANIPAGTYTLIEKITGAAVGIFKALEPIEGIVIFENKTNALVLGGTVNGNIEGADIKATDLFSIVNGYGTGNTLNYPGLNNNGDLFYIGVTNTRTTKEFASFCAFPGAHWFAGNGGGAGIGYMTAKSIEDAKYQQAFNYIVDNYYSDGDFFLYNSVARRVAQTVVWALLEAVDVTSEAWNNVYLSDVEKEAVIATLAAVEEGYIGNGLVIDVVYMLGVDSDLNQLDKDKWIDAQPQIVPVFGTFYVVNEEGAGPFYSKPAFNKTVYGDRAGLNEFAFDLFKKVGGDWVLVEASDFDIPEGATFTGSRFFTNKKGIVTTDFDLKAGSYMFKEVPKFLWAEPFHGEDGDYNLLWAANYPGGKDALYFEMVLVGNQYVVAWADHSGGGNPTVDNVITCKHNAFWNNLDFYYGIIPHQAIPYEGGWIIDFDDYCTGHLVPTYQPATCGVPGYIWYNCSDCYIQTSVIVADALEHDMVASGQFVYDFNEDGDLVAVAEWYACSYCGAGELRYFD